jgi:hypothetical protein
MKFVWQRVLVGTLFALGVGSFFVAGFYMVEFVVLGFLFIVCGIIAIFKFVKASENYCHKCGQSSMVLFDTAITHTGKFKTEIINGIRESRHEIIEVKRFYKCAICGHEEIRTTMEEYPDY